MTKTGRTAVATGALSVLVFASVPQPAAAFPCGVIDPVDRLLHCDRQGQSAPPADAGAASIEQTDPASATVASRTPRSRGLDAPRVDPTRLLVRFARRTSRRTVIEVARRAGGELERRIPAIGIDVVTAEPTRLQNVAAELRRSPLVRAVESEQLLAVSATVPNDPHWSEQSGLRIARFAEAWATSLGSPDVVIAVLDTGVSAGHPDLAGAVLPGYDVLNGDEDAADDHGHGTAVAGVVAARTNNALGIAGVCWLCRIVPVKVLGANGYGPSSAVAAGIVWAADHGADIINLSLGSPESTDALASAVGYANRRGALIVAAAGNAGATTPFYPAAEPGVLAVAATDDDDRPYSWSNRGGWVPVAAPGCLTTTLPAGYGFECGTSFAAPIVAGLAGLALGIRPELPAAELANVVRRGAVPIGPAVTSGRVDAARTLGLLPPARPQTVRKTLVVRSTLTRKRSTQLFSIRAATGPITARVSRPARRPTALELLAADGRAVARARGPAPRISKEIPAGAYRLRVSGAHGAFTLSIEYAATARALALSGRLSAAPAVYRETPPRPRIVLSKIGRVGARIGRGPWLGRPALPRNAPSIFAVPRLSDADELEGAIVAAINRDRRARGLRALQVSRALSAAGDAHARALGLAGAFTHDWPLAPRQPFGRWMERFYGSRTGRPWSAGENLLWAQDSLEAQEALTMWLNSPSHRRILVAPYWREIGVAVVRADGAGGVFGGRTVFIAAAEFGAR
jgi:subtilisin family serine protease/uncharacterized protein YkwD